MSTLKTILRGSVTGVLNQVMKNDGLRHAAVKYAEKAAWNSSMEDAYPYHIKEIEFIMTPEGEEIVSFLLTGYYPPKTFSVIKDKPRVICDFFDANLGTGIERFQELNGDFVQQIRIGIHKGSRPKIRVIIDLVPDENYDIRPVFFKEDNLYTLIVAKKK